MSASEGIVVICSSSLALFRFLPCIRPSLFFRFLVLIILRLQLHPQVLHRLLVSRRHLPHLRRQPTDLLNLHGAFGIEGSFSVLELAVVLTLRSDLDTGVIEGHVALDDGLPELIGEAGILGGSVGDLGFEVGVGGGEGVEGGVVGLDGREELCRREVVEGEEVGDERGVGQSTRDTSVSECPK